MGEKILLTQTMHQLSPRETKPGGLIYGVFPCARVCGLLDFAMIIG